MPRSRFLLVAAALALLAGTARPAAADITIFLGFTPTTTTRAARGIAVGAGILFLGFEFEYSNISEDTASDAPGLKTGMGNVLVQTPAVSGFQVYGTAGGGYASQTLAGDSHSTFASNLGGGVKIRLVGPLRVRVDYRVIKLGSSMISAATRLPTSESLHRFYAGANLSF
jgi:opacity protein-like surface antigen